MAAVSSDNSTFVFLVCTFNRRQVTEAFLTALNDISQTVSIRCVVVDDGSDDGTSEMVESFDSNYQIDILRSGGEPVFLRLYAFWLREYQR